MDNKVNKLEEIKDKVEDAELKEDISKKIDILKKNKTVTK